MKGGTLPALNGKGAWLDPVITELGWMFEGYNIACAGPNANLNLGDTFGFHIWIYFTDTEATQTIWCKEWLQTEGTKNMNSLRLCLRVDNGKFAVIYNPMDAVTHLKNENQTDSFNYLYQHIDLPVKYGWTYLAMNFATNAVTGNGEIWGYMANHDQCKLVSNTFTMTGPITDSNDYIFCLGGMVAIDPTAYTYSLAEPLLALVNGVVFVKGAVIERWNAFDAFGFQCHDYCQI